MDVPLGYLVLVRVDVLEVAREEDALALRECFGFEDERFRFLPVELRLELVQLRGEQPRGREERVLARVVLRHLHQVLSEVVLARERVHPCGRKFERAYRGSG